MLLFILYPHKYPHICIDFVGTMRASLDTTEQAGC